MLHQKSVILSLATLALLGSGCTLNDAPQADQAQWQELFNGEDIEDWTIKVRGFPVGENPNNTFSVTDGKLVASHDQYEEFQGEFGHIFYNEAFSHYILQVEYRFVGEQAPGGPEWAWRNNGIMYHSQAPQEMGLDQDFPVSIEFQLLGGDGETERSDANLCTPGTHVVKEGELRQDHCIESGGPTHHGDDWVTVELEVHGSELAQHRVDGEVVMEYTDLQLEDGTPLEGGYIALQAESHTTEIRSVRLLNLEGCMDEQANNYGSHLVKHNADACRY